MNIDKYLTDLVEIDNDSEDAVPEILAEIVSIIRTLIIEIQEKVKAKEDYTNETVLMTMQEQNDIYLSILKWVELNYPIVGELNQSAFFDMMINLGGTFKDMVDMYMVWYANNNIPEKEVN